LIDARRPGPIFALPDIQRHPRPETTAQASHSATAVADPDARSCARSFAMRRSAFIVTLLLAGLPAGSPAHAGQASAVIHVGITITGNAAQAPAKARTTRSGEQPARSPAGARATALKRPLPARPLPPQ
jgi:hypothetical protein